MYTYMYIYVYNNNNNNNNNNSIFYLQVASFPIKPRFKANLSAKNN